MCIGTEGDLSGVSVEECAVRMSRAGADLGMITNTNVNYIFQRKVKQTNIKASSVHTRRKGEGHYTLETFPSHLSCVT
jgi:hypothetical protein